MHQNKRLEIPISDDNDQFEIAPARNDGIVLYRMIRDSRSDQIEIIHTDTSFREKWRGALPVDKGFGLAKQIAARGNLYLIFFDRDFSNRNFLLYEINLNKPTYTRFMVMNSIPFFPRVFEVTSKGALIGGYFNRTPIVLFFEFGTQKSKILPGLLNEAGELAQVKINSDESFTVLISAKNYQKQQTLWLKDYNPTGKLERNFMLQPDGNNNLIFGRAIQTNNNSQIITGVYGNRNTDYSRGLFVARIADDGGQQIKYYNYADLENFFKYMRVKQEKRVKERITRKKIKGKKIKFQYRFLVHELVPYKDQFILLGEAFYPKYRQINGIYGVSGNTTYVFDGYQYTHAVVLGIDGNGKLLWDNSFEINDVRTFTLEQFVKMDAQKEKIALLYLYNNNIRTKVIQDSIVLEGKTSNQMRPGTNPESNRSTSISKLDYWYGDYFL
ncbi:MAG TPA: hypothetical protein VFU05_06920, partial [Cyclobacteriaceae bacterium]|nr:hypothetical protein [Cyclobacteriaceae bacterium]